MKTLEEFDYTQSPNVTAAKMRDLAEGGYIDRARPVLFIGECGTGKTPIYSRDSAWQRAVRNAGCVSPPQQAGQQRWSG